MGRRHVAPLLFALAGVVFLVAALIPRTPGTRIDPILLVLGLVFLIIAAGTYRRAHATPPFTTDPRLPARKVPQKHRR